MQFHQPESVDEAVKLLSNDEDARCLAGGATLVAMMNAQLLEPSTLVSLRNISELKMIDRLDGGAVRIGAMVRHRAIAAYGDFDAGQAVVAEAAGVIGHPAIRNMGTIGGSISHADAAADYPAALVAADAAVEIVGADGQRDVAAGAFFVDFLETALEPGEIVVGIRLPSANGAAGAYEKFARVEGDFATVSVAALVAMGGGTCSGVRIAVGACAANPVRVPEAEDALNGTELTDLDVDKAAEGVIAACDPVSDFRGSAEYRLALVPVMMRRAIAKAKQRAEANQ